LLLYLFSTADGQAVSATASDGQAMSATANGQAVSASVFDPCLVSLHPKAGERKTKGSRKRRHSAILTDTLEKRALEEERKKKLELLCQERQLKTHAS